jgi:UDP-N-acetylmuramoyl-tripeptide--D-alanyl-D-alanine ligase
LRPYSLSELGHTVGGRVARDAPGVRFTRVEIDSRQVQPGDLFVAIVGERVDGHDFVAAAKEKGARGAVIQHPVDLVGAASHQESQEGEFGLVVVDSTIKALDTLARSYLRELDVKTIGITGSVGKTSTKDLATAVLLTGFQTYSNPGNLNSHIGLPLAILAMDGSYEYALFEMAMRKRGEIADLCRTANPVAGILTDISLSHIGILGNLDEIAGAKAELLESLPSDGLALCAGDNPWVRRVSTKAACRTLFYGFGENCHCRGTNVKSLGQDGSSFDVLYGGSRFTFELRIPGVHQVQNALAAVALGLELNLSPDDVQQGLLTARLSPMRLDVLHLDGFTVLNDAYNASPKSMKAALDLLSDMGKGRKVAVLGEMLEMGRYGPEAHRDVGRYARQKADVLVSVGELGKEIVTGWQEQSSSDGVLCNQWVWFPDKEVARDFIEREVREGDVWLVKASRSIGMETLVDFMKTLTVAKEVLP